MRIRSSIIAVALLAGNGVIVQGQPKTIPAPEKLSVQDVRNAEEKWLEAYYRLDTATLAANEADDFTLITPSVLIDKQSQLGSVGSRQAVAPPGTPAFTLTRQQIRVYGNVAIVSDVCTIATGSKTPVTSAGTYWQTEVWRKVGTIWKIAHMHISVVEHGM